jgi:hypothetical protein
MTRFFLSISSFILLQVALRVNAMPAGGKLREAGASALQPLGEDTHIVGGFLDRANSNEKKYVLAYKPDEGKAYKDVQLKFNNGRWGFFAGSTALGSEFSISDDVKSQVPQIQQIERHTVTFHLVKHEIPEAPGSTKKIPIYSHTFKNSGGKQPQAVKTGTSAASGATEADK